MGGGCCIGDCGFCCIADCGFCCVMDFCSDSGCCVGDSPSPRGSSGESVDIANELAEMCEVAARKALEEENNIIEQVNGGVEDFLRVIQEINEKAYGGRKLNINEVGLREENQRLINETRGFIGRRLSDRLVNTDAEVSVILAERNKHERKKNFDDFYNRILKEAMEALAKRIEESGKKQWELIVGALDQRMAEVESSMDRIEHEYGELIEKREHEKSKADESRKGYMYLLELDELLLDQIREGRKTLS